MRISTKWIKHTKDKEEREQILRELLAVKPAFDRLITLIEEQKLSTIRAAKSKENYDKPSWAYYQADLLGQERAYTEVLKLLTITFEEE